MAMESSPGTAGAEDFDAVLMLTWSDWHKEPRSNRYHFGSRFARHAPVLFLQPVLPEGSDMRVEASEVPGLDILSLPAAIGAREIAQVLQLLRDRGIRRPILWIYSCLHYDRLLDALPQALRVYHATEDYFTPSLVWSSQDVVVRRARSLLQDVDLVVGVSARVIDSYSRLGGFQGPVHLSANGCDAPFFFDIAQGMTQPPREKIALFQGGINSRLDYKLLFELAARLKDWNFWFVGNAESGLPGWSKLLRCENVSYLGPMDPEAVARKMCEATVGIIPFVQDGIIWNSLPLKAYEYVACGLPVVSVPIQALMEDRPLFSFEISAEGFARAIQAAAATRNEPQALALRREAALRNSYEDRFAGVLAQIRKVIARRRAQRKRLNVCVLYDPGSNRVNTIREHLEAYGRYSRHDIVYMPGTDARVPGFAVTAGGDPVRDAAEPDFSFFDVVIVHYSVRVCIDGHMAPHVESALQRYAGHKVLFIQDEYDTPEVTRRWMERAGVDVVYTCVPADSVHKLYPRERFPCVEFRQTLTGYVPEHPALDDYARPLAERPFLIGYRGRKLPPIYGSLGWDKYLIGREVRKLADARGLKVDVEVDDARRIYGQAWYQFLGSARATLGTESGCNLFDFDGSAEALIRARRAQDPQADYWSMREELAAWEGEIRMNQISPKIFESIRTRTVLVLFEGGYSGVVLPHRHYIPLKRDFSNFDDVVRQLQDDDFVRDLTDRAYEEIVESGRYSYANFVAGVDRDLEQSLVRGARARLFSFPLVALTPQGRIEHLGAEYAAGAMLSSGVVDRESVRDALVQYGEHVARQVGAATAVSRELATFVPTPMAPPRAGWVRRLWHMVPLRMRRPVGGALRGFLQRHRLQDAEKGLADRLVAAAWRLLPSRAKRVVRRLL
jgi:glycosyltransferase involved in cell wall biosynthesis